MSVHEELDNGSAKGRQQPRLWTELRIEASEEVSDAVSDFLVGLLGRGVILEDLEVDNPAEPFSRKVLIKAYLSREDLDSGAMKEIENYIYSLVEFHAGYEVVRLLGHEPVVEDWHESWKRFFKPVKVGKRLVVKPSWEPFVPDPDDIVIEIDPGQAFGVGTHASTRLMLQEMEGLWAEQGWDRDGLLRHELPTVLDVGCGTGILGIAAAKLGASSVQCIDIDPAAEEAARKNIRLNHCHDIVAVSLDPIWKVEGPYRVVLANLDRDTIGLLAADLARQTEGGGFLLVSGILKEQLPKVKEVLERQGLEEIGRGLDSEGEWAVIRFQKRAG